MKPTLFWLKTQRKHGTNKVKGIAMKFFSSGLTAAVLVSAGLLLAANPAGAADGSNKSVKVKKHHVKVKIKPDEDRFLHGSKETQTMRDSRLTRECRGAANGGACSGYTR